MDSVQQTSHTEYHGKCTVFARVRVNSSQRRSPFKAISIGSPLAQFRCGTVNVSSESRSDVSVDQFINLPSSYHDECSCTQTFARWLDRSCSLSSCFTMIPSRSPSCSSTPAYGTGVWLVPVSCQGHCEEIIAVASRWNFPIQLRSQTHCADLAY